MINSAEDRAARRVWESLPDRFEPPTRPRRPTALPHLLRRRPSLLLSHVGARIARVVEEALTSLGLDSREFAVLTLLVLAEGPMAQQTIARRLERDRTTIMKLVRSLESKGLVDLVRDPADRRANAVSATKTGIVRFHSADVNLEAAEFELFGPLSVEDEQRLCRSLERLQ